MNKAAASIWFLIAVIAMTFGCQAVGSPFRRVSAPVEESPEAPRPDQTASPAQADTARTETERPMHDRETVPVALLLSFTWTDDPAARDFEQSFTFALHQAGLADRVVIIRTGSPFETAAACDRLMPSGGPLLTVFVGDEGSAAAAALMSTAFHAPLLKITGDQRSYTEFNPYLYEFLPTGQTQAEQLATYAVSTLKLKSMMLLTPDDAKGRAQVEGFKSVLAGSECQLEAEADYDPNGTHVRSELAVLFSNEKRLERGHPPLQTALSPQERTEMFGDPAGGDVLFGTIQADSADSLESIPSEGLFFVVSPERMETFAAQLPRLPDETAFLGNSSWLNEDALARFGTLTEGMYIAAPLLPAGSDTMKLLRQFEDSTGGRANVWELLGLDAGQFVSQILRQEPRTRSEVMRIIPELTPFTGAAVEVDFSEGRENSKVRILHYQNGELREVTN